ncbi:cytochrome-c peroxidase [Prosthecobacter sp.]|uniref:cytochrome-c peroxidase n=1 Tax=Prosthecobacter sp. TaxID=1965333 RepID=UPI002487B336|nr:cytochrome-c peroxidase [Prosthecobacter sp.]MDI1313424.1 cytochrome-c peroxidase [Prosthecobacter sp.]
MYPTARILALFVGLSTVSAFAQADLTEAFLPMFAPLPSEVASPTNELTEAKINLGRLLYFENRISKGGKMSCNSCHMLAKYGTDNLPFSPGHEGKLGGRSSPSVYNAALHVAQFWDGRAPSVEEQAKGPVLNPVEMGAPSEEFVIKVLKSMPDYVESFRAAFPGETDPVNYNNFGKAVGAFERKLLTPSKWDVYLKGDKAALSAEEKKGFSIFVKTGCVTCHNGVGVGGMMYQKLGLLKAWPELTDNGRSDFTKSDSEKFFFKVPSLRNITETGPYLHDGSVKTLEDMVKRMAEYQLGKTLSDEEVASIVIFLNSLKGDLPTDYIKAPKLPESTADTPKA